MQETPVQFLGQENWLTTPVFLGFPGGSASQESACNARDLVSIPGLGRSPGEGNSNPFQYSCQEPGGYRPWGCKESDTTERLALTHSRP